VVIIVALSAYTSGAQLCKGAAAILNNNPIKINIKPKLNPNNILLLSTTEIILYIESKLVNPVKEYINPQPNNIIQDAKLPNKKYFNPADIANSECLYKEANIYTPKDCNSKLKYKVIKLEQDINNKEPKVDIKTIIEYFIL
jgi:hypothetical protein